MVKYFRDWLKRGAKSDEKRIRRETVRMCVNWEAAPMSVRQDYVIAHVVGATVIGYFPADESRHLLLDIGSVGMTNYR